MLTNVYMKNGTKDSIKPHSDEMNVGIIKYEPSADTVEVDFSQ